MGLTQPESRPRELEAKSRAICRPGNMSPNWRSPTWGNRQTAVRRRRPAAAPLRAPFAVTPRETTEMNELALNLPLLEELAAKSGGKVFTPETSAGSRRIAQTAAGDADGAGAETKLWRSWPTLLLFVALLTLEWAGRKWAGLP